MEGARVKSGEFRKKSSSNCQRVVAIFFGSEHHRCSASPNVETESFPGPIMSVGRDNHGMEVSTVPAKKKTVAKTEKKVVAPKAAKKAVKKKK